MIRYIKYKNICVTCRKKLLKCDDDVYHIGSDNKVVSFFKCGKFIIMLATIETHDDERLSFCFCKDNVCVYRINDISHCNVENCYIGDEHVLLSKLNEDERENFLNFRKDYQPVFDYYKFTAPKQEGL